MCRHHYRYERLIYLSPDAMAVHVNELDSLFYCGEFCAIYDSTPCVMSPGLFVLKVLTKILSS